uniref:Uncharacterized protein n=1 Tax=Timema bartmani TaxID=61472 RepID=A0A7R9ETF2_9NEOP|nr:unnamed protein product [Timema bartmani]
MGRKLFQRPADIPEILWFEEENDLIRSCAVLSSALGLQKSFSTSDISQLPSPEEAPPQPPPRCAISELALTSIQRSGYLLDHPRLEHASRKYGYQVRFKVRDISWAPPPSDSQGNTDIRKYGYQVRFKVRDISWRHYQVTLKEIQLPGEIQGQRHLLAPPPSDSQGNTDIRWDSRSETSPGRHHQVNLKEIRISGEIQGQRHLLGATPFSWAPLLSDSLGNTDIRKYGYQVGFKVRDISLGHPQVTLKEIRISGEIRGQRHLLGPPPSDSQGNKDIRKYGYQVRFKVRDISWAPPPSDSQLKERQLSGTSPHGHKDFLISQVPPSRDSRSFSSPKYLLQMTQVPPPRDSRSVSSPKYLLHVTQGLSHLPGTSPHGHKVFLISQVLPPLDSRSCSTWVAVGDVASTSQLPSPHGGQSSTAPVNAPPAFTAADLIRSVNKKVRQNYIRRRLLTTYKALERLSQSEFNLDQLEVSAATAAASTGGSGGGGTGPGPTRLAVPGTQAMLRVVKQRANKNLPLTIRDVERERGKPLSKYERNMMIFNWLHTLDDSAFEGMQ